MVPIELVTLEWKSKEEKWGAKQLSIGRGSRRQEQLVQRSCGGTVPDVLGSDKLASEIVPGMRGKGLRKAEHREILERTVAFTET